MSKPSDVQLEFKTCNSFESCDWDFSASTALDTRFLPRERSLSDSCLLGSAELAEASAVSAEVWPKAASACAGAVGTSEVIGGGDGTGFVKELVFSTCNSSTSRSITSVETWDLPGLWLSLTSSTGGFHTKFRARKGLSCGEGGSLRLAGAGAGVGGRSAHKSP